MITNTLFAPKKALIEAVKKKWDELVAVEGRLTEAQQKVDKFYEKKDDLRSKYDALAKTRWTSRFQHAQRKAEKKGEPKLIFPDYPQVEENEGDQ